MKRDILFIACLIGIVIATALLTGCVWFPVAQHARCDERANIACVPF